MYLDDEMHARLRVMARKQGRTVSDLVREAVARVYTSGDVDERLMTLQAVQGIWSDRSDTDDSREYVRRLRKDTRPNR